MNNIVFGAENRVGHNHGPSMEKGHGFRKLSWSKARAQLLPKLPVEIIRRRVPRAKELGLDYKSYASVRAASGHDVVAFLFSSNALRLLKGVQNLPHDRVEKLTTLKGCERLVAVQKPLDIQDILQAAQRSDVLLDQVINAPDISHSWGQSRAIILTALAPHNLPADRVVAIGDTALEREWCGAGRLAGYLSAQAYFGASQ